MSKNRRRGKRYDDNPKLNVKKVVLTVITIIVVILIVFSIKKMFNNEPLTQDVSTQITYFPAYADGKWGVIDNFGNVIVSLSNDEIVAVPDSNDDLFICTYNIDYNSETYDTKVINKNNEVILENYKNVQAIENTNGNEVWYEKDILKFVNNGKYGLIDFDGKIILDAEYDEIYALEGIEKNIIVQKNGKKGLVNSSVGELIIQPEYDEIETLSKESSNDGYIVKKDGLYGVMSADSKKILECKYNDIQNITSDGYYVVSENGNNKIINVLGTTILDIKYEKIKEINGNNIIVSTGNNCGIIDLNGTIILNLEYDDLRYIFEKYYIASKNGMYGIISLTGEQVVEFKYTSIDYVKEADLIQADNSDLTTDILNRKFEKKFENVIISQINIDGGYLKIRQNSEYRYYNFSFEEKTSQEALISNTLFLVKENGKYGFNNKNGERIVDCNYDDAKEQNEYGYCAIQKNGLWGAIKSDGTVVLEPTVNLSESLYIDFIGMWHYNDEFNAYTK